MLYLIRHAHAVDSEDDDSRELSSAGRAQVRRLASFLLPTGQVTPDEIWHSPLARAAQTAALLAECLKLDVPRKKVAGLRSEDDPAVIAGRLPPSLSIALVGHEPHLGCLASLLVTGDVFPPAFSMGKCAILALERIRETNPGGWAVRWHIGPELLA